MAPPLKSQTVAPNQSLYVSNLPDKLPKSDLRRQLYMLFTPYGTVLDVVALKTPKMRGQAHVVFKDIATAAVAMRALEGSTFFGKEMRITYAKGKSDFIAKLDGSFKMPVFGTSAAKSSDTNAVGDKGTALQQSVFGGAPGKPLSQPHGVKRTREEESDKEEKGEKEEEDDSDDAEMDMDESD